MDFQKMWFNLKEELNKKNSWGKNEVKGLMESIEVNSNKTTVTVKLDTSYVEELIKKNADRLKEKHNSEELSEKIKNRIAKGACL